MLDGGKPHFVLVVMTLFRNCKLQYLIYFVNHDSSETLTTRRMTPSDGTYCSPSKGIDQLIVIKRRYTMYTGNLVRTAHF